VKKVLYATACLVAAFLVYSMVGTPTVSQAADLNAEGTVVKTDKVIWVQIDLPQTKAKKVRIELRTPKVNEKRQLWQYCDMEYVGLGTYRCGLDVTGATPARTMDGQWLGTFKVDGNRIDSVTLRSTN
jgi:hypothetical protein